MLQKIRDHSTGWLSMFLLGLLVLSFAIWGIDFRFGGSDFLVKVNGEDVDPNRVTRTYQQQLASYQSAFPEGIPPVQLEQLKRNVLEATARDEVIWQYASASGMRVSDSALASFIEARPEFQFEDAFSFDFFQLSAEREGYTAKGFEEYIRRAMVNQQLGSALLQTSFVTAEERARRGALEGEKRAVSYFRIPALPFREGIQPDETAIAAEYESDQDRYRTEDRVKIEYIELNPDFLASEVAVDDETVRKLYDVAVGNGEYVQDETRNARHILVAVSGDTDDAAAKASAESILARIRAGEDFAALAAEFSDDPGSKTNGGDLGWAAREAYVGPFSDSLFSMAEGDISEPVRTTFGYHIIEVVGIRAGETKPFDEVRAQILEEERLRLAVDQIDELSQQLDEAVYDNDDSLQPAADATGLEVKMSDWITRSAGGGIAANAVVREAAFSDSVYLDRRNSQALRVGDGYVYIRITEHEPSKLRSLEESRPSIVALLVRRLAAEKAKQAGLVAREKLAAGSSIEELATEAGAEFSRSAEATRRGSALPGELATAAFSVPAPGDKPTVGGAEFSNGDYAVFQVESAAPGEALDDAGANRIAQARGSIEFRAFVESLYDKADVETRPSALQ